MLNGLGLREDGPVGPEAAEHLRHPAPLPQTEVTQILDALAGAGLRRMPRGRPLPAGRQPDRGRLGLAQEPRPDRPIPWRSPTTSPPRSATAASTRIAVPGRLRRRPAETPPDDADGTRPRRSRATRSTSGSGAAGGMGPRGEALGGLRLHQPDPRRPRPRPAPGPRRPWPPSRGSARRSSNATGRRCSKRSAEHRVPARAPRRRRHGPRRPPRRSAPPPGRPVSAARGLGLRPDRGVDLAAARSGVHARRGGGDPRPRPRGRDPPRDPGRPPGEAGRPRGLPRPRPRSPAGTPGGPSTATTPPRPDRLGPQTTSGPSSSPAEGGVRPVAVCDR